MTKAASFTKADYKRAVLAVAEGLKAGDNLTASVDFKPDGTISVLIAPADRHQPLTDLERWERDHGHRAA